MSQETTSSTVDFVTFADENYAKWIDLWLRSLRHTNPDSRLYIYDISFQASGVFERLVAGHSNAEVVPWPPERWQSPAWVEKTDFSFFWPGFNFRDEIKSLARRWRYRLTGRKKDDWMIDKRAFVALKQFFIRVCCEKPHIILDAWRRSDKPLIYVDSDAVVLSRFDHFPDPQSDFLTTVVSPEQVRIGGPWEPLGPDGPLPVTLINAGVVMANRTPGAQSFLQAWILEMERVRHGAADQTALANLIYRMNPHFHQTLAAFEFDAGTGPIRLGGLPCAEYNQVRIARDGNGIDTRAHIAHFVGSWKQAEHWGLVEAIVAQALARSTTSPEQR